MLKTKVDGFYPCDAASGTDLSRAGPMMDINGKVSSALQGTAQFSLCKICRAPPLRSLWISSNAHSDLHNTSHR